MPQTLAEAVKHKAHVVLNGGSFDFLMNEDPLELMVERSVGQARAIADSVDGGAALRGLGEVLAAGGSVEIRLGNHDAELALTAVQEVFRAALGQPSEVASELVFTRGDAPGILEINGVRVLLAHGEHNDPWNFVDYKDLDADGHGHFKYPPGSRLVKTLLNPLKRRFGMRFADLLKPDFQGGVLTMLAVDPSALSLVFQGSTFRLLWQLLRRVDEPVSFEPGMVEEDLGLDKAMDAAGLTPDERGAIEAVLDPEAAQSFGLVGDLLGSARVKLARQGLRLYAATPRHLA